MREYRPEDNAYCGTLDRTGVDMAYYPRYQNRQQRMHSVEVLLLSCILDGRGTHFMGDTTYRESGASIGIVTYGQTHDIVTETPMEIMNVFLDPQSHRLPSMPGRFQSALPALLPSHPNLGNRLSRMIHLSIGDPDRVRRLLFTLFDELSERRYGFEDNSRHLLASLLIEICRTAEEQGITRSGPDDEAMEVVRAQLDRSFHYPLRLEDLASSCRLSRSSLCRRFKEYTGKTVFTYLIDRRIEAALVQLRNSNARVSEIALDCGFNDLGFFSRKFRERIKMTPTEYRQLPQVK